jgi:hypothetical protein
VLCKGMDEREASLRSIRRSVEEARGGYAAAEAMAEVCGIIITACSVLTRLFFDEAVFLRGCFLTRLFFHVAHVTPLTSYSHHARLHFVTHFFLANCS